jgi:TolA-binding protein
VASLPGGERWKHPAFPAWLRSLAARGRSGEALAAVEEALPSAKGAPREAALLAAGEILWREGRRDEAERRLREIPPASPCGADAAFLLARSLAGKGDLAGAARLLQGSPPGARREYAEALLDGAAGSAPVRAPAAPAARIASLEARGGVEAARELFAAGTDASLPLPLRSRALRASSLLRLREGKAAEALDGARADLALFPAWERAVEDSLPWDGTREGARLSAGALRALLPREEDARRYLAAEERFLALADAVAAAREGENGARRAAREARSLREGILEKKRAVDEEARRSEEIRGAGRSAAVEAGSVRGRLRTLAENLPIASLGRSADPPAAARLEELDRRIAEIRSRLDRVRETAEGRSRSRTILTSLSGEQKMMLFLARDRAARLEDALDLAEAEGASLRWRLWNRWKNGFVRKAAPVGAEADRLARLAASVESRAGARKESLLSWSARLGEWSDSLARFDASFRRDADALAAREGEVKGKGREALSEARRLAREALLRDGRAGLRLAGRGAFELRASLGERADSAAERGRLLEESIRHYRKSLPPEGAEEPGTEESLFALATLRYEESEARYFTKEGETADRPDYSEAVALFRKVEKDYPRGEYAEHALYGLSLCLQETGDAEGSADAMEALLARYPSTRYADEVHLRLAEWAFDVWEYGRAERHYRAVSSAAPADLRATAAYKLGWAILLQSRPAEAPAAFLDALLLSPEAKKTGGLEKESLRMLARSLVESDKDAEAEEMLARRNASSRGPELLLLLQGMLDTNNRYEQAAAVADRLAAAWPLAPERVDVEAAAAEALLKARKEDASFERRGRFPEIFGPGSPWQGAPSRTAGEIARANGVAEEGLRASSFHFHRLAREGRTAERPRVLAGYDAFLAKFPASPKAEEVAYQRGWLLFEDGRKGESKGAFEAVASRRGAREEAARYMAVQSAKDLSAGGGAAELREVDRLALAYERALPKGERLPGVVLDRARALRALKDHRPAAEAGLKAAALATAPKEKGEAYRIAGDSLFESGDFGAAEEAFRGAFAAVGTEPEGAELRRWIAFSRFRRAETLPPGRVSEAADLFLSVAREFPDLDTAPTARFRGASALADAKRGNEAVAVFLEVEKGSDRALSLESTRRLARMYEERGEPLPAAERCETLAAASADGKEKIALLLRGAVLYGKAKAGDRYRGALLAAEAVEGAEPALRVDCRFRVAESLAAEGRGDEADLAYLAVTDLGKTFPEASPDLVGKAYFLRAERRFPAYMALAIVPPLEESFSAKQKMLEECVSLYGEAASRGDGETTAASLHRIGEGLEGFRTAILASPPPPEFSAPEKEEYAFLLEEKAGPIEEKAVEAYRKNLLAAVAGDVASPWVDRTVARLKALRPAVYGKRGDFAFPVLPVPDFRGIVERSEP